MTFPPPTEKQARIIWLAVTGLASAALVALVATLIWGLGRALQILAPVLWPLAIAGVVAYLLDPVVDFFERKGVSRPRAIICVFGMALVVVAAVFGSIVPQLVRETRQLAARVPGYAIKLEQRIELWVNKPPPLLQELLKRETRAAGTAEPAAPAGAPEILSPAGTTNTAGATTDNPALFGGAWDEKTLRSATGWLASVSPRVGRWLFGQVGRVASWLGFLAGLVLVPVYAFYLLLEKRGIESSWTNYLPVADSRFKDELVFVLRSINGYLIAFFRGQVLVALCDAILYTIGFLIVGLPYAVLLGAAAVVLTMIPFLGAITICVAALIIAFVQFGDWLHPLFVLGVFAIVQTLESLVISPRIMKGRVGLHPLTIIIAVMVGTTLLGGLLGGILAIPFTAVLRVLMGRYVWTRKEPLNR
jgi:predicted PurR-regulated permease PerM